VSRSRARSLPPALADVLEGPNEDQLYVTTAHCGAVDGDPGLQTQFPDSGHLFVVDLAGRFQGGKWRFAFGG
jgi:hypothetical protein